MNDEHATLTLARPLERALRDGHPWVYRDAVRGAAAAGAVTTLLDGRGQFVARGLAEEGPIALRVFTTRDEALCDALLRARIEDAASLRDAVVPTDTDAYRLIHGEGDRLPGFVVDVYERCAVLKTDGAAAFRWRDRFASSLRATLEARGVRALLVRASNTGTVNQDDSGDEALEPERKASLVWGALDASKITVREHGMALVCDLMMGQKTGLFLDQREARRMVRAVSKGRRVLNLYAYTGGFSVAAGLGGARSVETVDVARGAVELAVESWRANGLDPATHAVHCEDVWKHLAQRSKARARYDLVIADPPSFAPRAQSVPKALDAYRSLHAAALSLVSPGGLYLAGSCSSHITRAMFEETVREGARRAKRSLQLLEARGAPGDHPRIPAFTEGDYLKADLYCVR